VFTLKLLDSLFSPSSEIARNVVFRREIVVVYEKGLELGYLSLSRSVSATLRGKWRRSVSDTASMHVDREVRAVRGTCRIWRHVSRLCCYKKRSKNKGEQSGIRTIHHRYIFTVMGSFSHRIIQGLPLFTATSPVTTREG